MRTFYLLLMMYNFICNKVTTKNMGNLCIVKMLYKKLKSNVFHVSFHLRVN